MEWSDSPADADEEAKPFFENDEAAAIFIQRKYKSRNARKLLALFPSLQQLKDVYLDEKAKAAGAADSKWYTSQALKAREFIRRSEEVQQLCEEAWQAVMNSSRQAAYDSAFAKAMTEGWPQAEAMKVA